MTEAGAEFRGGLGTEMGDASQRQGDAMSMHGSYDEYGQNETADLVRSVALSSAKLWEEVFDRLRRLEEAQVELRAMLGRIEAQLPAGPSRAALSSGTPSVPAWPDRAIGAAEPGIGASEPVIGDHEQARTDLFVPGPADEPATTTHVPPRDAVDLLVGTTPGPVAPQPVDEEPATFFFPPTDEAPGPADAGSQEDTGWPGSEAIGMPGWTSPHTVRYDEGFTSRDVVGPPTEEVQAIDVTLPERSNAEYFGRHAAGPPPGFAVANGDGAQVSNGIEPEIPLVHAPEVDAQFDPAINEQLQRAAQALEMQAGTAPDVGTLPAPPYGFATGADFTQQDVPDFEAWGESTDTAGVPLVFAPGDEPTPATNDNVPPPPAGFAPGGEATAALGFDSFPSTFPPPPPGFATEDDAPPPPPGFSTGAEVPPPPLGFGTADADVPPPPPGFAPPGFAPGAGGEVPPPPPPPGFAAGGEVPPPPLGFGSADAGVPAPPPGFAPPAFVPGAGGDVPPPPPPPGFAAGGEVPPPPLGFGTPVSETPPAPLGFSVSGDAAPPPPPPGFVGPAAAAAPAASGFTSGAELAGAMGGPPPPPAAFASGPNGQPASGHRVPSMGGSIADDVLAIGSMTQPPDASNGNGNENGNGHAHELEDAGPPPPITPDFFARAGRRRR